MIRVLGVTFGTMLLAWAYEILSNIWEYNDSGTATYAVIAVVPGFTGLLLVYWSLRRPRRAPRSG